MPVALTITELDLGGAERALVALAAGLDRARWAPSVVALGPEGPLVEPLRRANIPTVCLGVDKARPVRAVAQLAGALRQFRPELVQSFLFHANIATRLAAPLAARPWVLGGVRVAEREKGWHRRLDRQTQALAAGSVCVSRGVSKFAIASGLSPNRLSVIPNGVDLEPYDRAEPFSPAELDVPPGARLALFVGRLTRQKGVPILLDALSGIAADRPDWRLLLVGDGPDRPALQARTAHDPVLSDRVRWLGRRDDIPRLLATVDLLVLPSLWEGMPNVILEAMAARRAVVATAVEGAEELVETSGTAPTGWLVPPGDPTALADALRDATADADRLRERGRNGRKIVEARYRPAGVVAAYERLWARLLGLEPPQPDDYKGKIPIFFPFEVKSEDWCVDDVN